MSKDVVLSFQKASTVFINYLGASPLHASAAYLGGSNGYWVKPLRPTRSLPRNSTKAYQPLTSSRRSSSSRWATWCPGSNKNYKVRLPSPLPLTTLPPPHAPTVYRDVQKSGKGGKGKAREAQVEGKSASSASSSRPRQKAREKEKTTERGPTITINRPQAQAQARSVPRAPPRESVNGHARGAVEDEEMDEGEGEEDEEMEDEEEDEGEDEDEDEDAGDEEAEDSMAVDDEDARREARGLEDSDDGE